MDSTILADAVATQDTVTQAGVGRPPGGAGGTRRAQQVAAVCTGHDYGKPGKPKTGWDDPQAKDALVLGSGQRRERARGGAARP